MRKTAEAEIAPISIDRIVERFGHLAAIREALLAREDIAAATRLTLVAKVSETLVDFVSARQWLDVGHAQRIAREACEKATVTRCGRYAFDANARAHSSSARRRATHRRPDFARAACPVTSCCSRKLWPNSPTCRSSASRVSYTTAAIRGLLALFDQAELPPSTYPAFKEAIEALREGGLISEPGGAARLKRRTIERVLTRCENEDIGELAPLLTLLRRFATEAAREEARMFCDELVAESLEDENRSEAA